MFYIRTTKTASGSTAVQVVRYENRRKIIAVHIGSAHTPQELLSLKQTAQVWIKKTTGTKRFFRRRIKTNRFGNQLTSI